MPKLGAEIPEPEQFREQPLFVNVLERNEEGDVKITDSYKYTGNPEDAPQENYDYFQFNDKN